MGGVVDVEVIDDPATAAVAVKPVRAEILARLAVEGSATSLAHDLGLPRQKVNYHLRLLEDHGLVELIGERPRRGVTERLFVATAAAFVVSPTALGAVAADPRRVRDRLSARFLIALGARLVGEVAALVRGAEAAGKPLPTLSIDTEIRLRSAGDRAAFTAELADAVTELARRYHDEGGRGGRWVRLIVAAHPRPAEEQRA
jgi:DNA-binding transcriptional ArsR family regulator